MKCNSSLTFVRFFFMIIRMKVLGIETSCDDTGVAIYDSEQGLIGNKLYSQVAMHAEYGGVVPELASRDHLRKTLPLIKQLLAETQLTANNLNGIAYTHGPGLVGALLVGACIGRSLAWAWGLPAVGVHHLEGHLLAVMLEQQKPAFPFIALLVSGGHTLLVHVEAFGSYTVLGETLDDAVGEAFDKTAKLLGLAYPGGALLEKIAQQGDPHRFHFPRPMLNRPGLAFSFSGLKTFAVNTFAEAGNDEQTRADIARAFQDAVVETLVIKCRRAIQQTGVNTLVVAGGVGANNELRRGMQSMVTKQRGNVYFPRPAFCTDNGAMIAYAGCLHLLAGKRQGLAVEVKPRIAL